MLTRSTAKLIHTYTDNDATVVVSPSKTGKGMHTRWDYPMDKINSLPMIITPSPSDLQFMSLSGSSFVSELPSEDYISWPYLSPPSPPPLSHRHPLPSLSSLSSLSSDSSFGDELEFDDIPRTPLRRSSAHVWVNDPSSSSTCIDMTEDVRLPTDSPGKMDSFQSYYLVLKDQREKAHMVYGFDSLEGSSDEDTSWDGTELDDDYNTMSVEPSKCQAVEKVKQGSQPLGPHGTELIGEGYCAEFDPGFVTPDYPTRWIAQQSTMLHRHATEPPFQ